MNTRTASLAVVASLVVAGGFAAFQTHANSHANPSPVITPSPAGGIDTGLQRAQELPPNHPPIGSADSPHASTFAAASADEPAAIAWTAPPSWRIVPNPSSMRIATYRIPRATGDNEEAELSVSRAGGTAKANADRWIGQFDGAATASREERTLQGFRVTTVSVTGTFLGGAMMGAPSSPRESWALLGAIVETPESPYFFKLVGPASTVKAARAPFEAMIAGVKHS